MYYCQACDDPRLMEPNDGVACCPACGNVDPTAVIRPLFVVTGASGSGKTTIFPELLSRMSGWCAVFDADWLIDPLGRAAKDGQIDWTAFSDTWLHVAHGVAQNGLPTLLLAPFIPEHLENLPGRAWIGEIYYLVLDCPDDERRRRMAARPRWRARDIDAQTEFGRWLRGNLAPVIDTTRQSPAEVAETVAAWARDRLAALPAEAPAGRSARGCQRASYSLLSCRQAWPSSPSAPAWAGLGNRLRLTLSTTRQLSRITARSVSVTIIVRRLHTFSDANVAQ